MTDQMPERPPEGSADRRAAFADGSWMLWTSTALVAVWVGVILISVFAPDLVSGSQQEHLPLAAFATWLWGLVGTVAVIWAMNRLRGKAERKPIWTGFAGAVIGLWLAATLLSIFLPVMETGTDPTRLPLAALLVPLAAALLTALSAFVTVEFGRSPKPE